MIPNDQPLRGEMIKRMLDNLTDKIDVGINNLTKWESDFIISINSQFYDRGNLSDKQCKVLERIYDQES